MIYIFIVGGKTNGVMNEYGQSLEFEEIDFDALEGAMCPVCNAEVNAEKESDDRTCHACGYVEGMNYEDIIKKCLTPTLRGYTWLFWDCTCEDNFIRPYQQLTCFACGAHQTDRPPSRVSLVRAMHLEWKLDDFLYEKMEEYQDNSLPYINRNEIDSEYTQLMSEK